MKFQCLQCGECCRTRPINICDEDMDRWFKEGRHDILFEVTFLDHYHKDESGGFYFLQTARNPKQPCPFLKDNRCDIHETKPLACKDAPFGYKTMPECPAFEYARDDIAKHYPQVARRQRRAFLRTDRRAVRYLKLLERSRRLM